MGKNRPILSCGGGFGVIGAKRVGEIKLKHKHVNEYVYDEYDISLSISIYVLSLRADRNLYVKTVSACISCGQARGGETIFDPSRSAQPRGGLGGTFYTRLSVCLLARFGFCFCWCWNVIIYRTAFVCLGCKCYVQGDKGLRQNLKHASNTQNMCMVTGTGSAEPTHGHASFSGRGFREEQWETCRWGPDHSEGENTSRWCLAFSARAGLNVWAIIEKWAHKPKCIWEDQGTLCYDML